MEALIFTAIASLVNFALNASAAVADHVAKDQAAKANKEAAEKSLAEVWKDITIRQSEEQDAASMSIMAIDRQARQADALARVSAGEAGVAGASVDMILNGITRDRSTAVQTTQRNAQMTMDQLQRDKLQAKTQADNQIAGVPGANPFLTGLRIAGAAANSAGQFIDRLPNPGVANKG
jgi:hypothetical protein